MKLLKNIVSLYKPNAIEHIDNLVKVRENIKDIIITDELFSTERSAYMYDETVYTEEEYEMKWENDITEIKNDIKDVKKEIELLELVIAEILESNNKDEASSVVLNAVSSLNTIYAKYSAIAQMYANMIEKGIYTIDRVPSKWKSEVEAILEENKED